MHAITRPAAIVLAAFIVVAGLALGIRWDAAPHCTTITTRPLPQIGSFSHERCTP